MASDINDLFDLSSIYLKLYATLQANPDYLIIEVMSRLKSRSKDAQALASSSGLLLERPYIENEHLFIRNIFETEAKSQFTIVQYYPHQNGSFMFVLEKMNNVEFFKLSAVDLKSYRILRDSLEFKFKLENIQFFIENDSFDSLKSIHQINGTIYFSVFDKLYYFKISNTNKMVQRKFDFEIKDLVLLGPNSLLVQLPKILLFLNFKYPEFTINQKEVIQLLRTTICKDTVYSKSFLSQNNTVYIFVGLLSKIIKIYQFSSDTTNTIPIRVITSINWSFYGKHVYETLFSENPISFVTIQLDSKHWAWRESLLIDRAFILDEKPDISANRKNDMVLRFAVEEKGLVKVIEVNCYGMINTINIDVTKFFTVLPLKDENLTRIHDTIELEAFFNNRIVFKFFANSRCWSLYEYNLTSKTCTIKKTFNDSERIDCTDKLELIVRPFRGKLVLYEFNKNSIDEVYCVIVQQKHKTNPEYNIEKKSEKMINNKLLRIEIEERKYIQEVDYLSYKKILHEINGIKLNEVYQMLDDSHFLVSISRDDSCLQVAVIDAIRNTIIHSIVFNTKPNVRVIDSNNHFFVLLNMETIKLLFYKINQKTFNFNEIAAVPIDMPDRCIYWSMFDELCQDSLVFRFYDEQKKFYVIVFIEILNNSLNEENFKVDRYIVNFEKENYNILMTSLTKYLVAYTRLSRANALYYINPFENTILKEHMLHDYIRDVIVVKHTDDLIVLTDHAITYIELCKNFEIKEYVLRQSPSKPLSRLMYYIGDYIAYSEMNFDSSITQSFELCKLETLMSDKKLDRIFYINEKVQHKCISNDQRYLAIVTFDTMILTVYDLEEAKKLISSPLQRVESISRQIKIANIQLKDSIDIFTGIYASDRYVYVGYQNNLLSFKFTKIRDSLL